MQKKSFAAFGRARLMVFQYITFQSLAEILRNLKSNSTGWIHEKWGNRWRFEWQRGYFGVTVSQSQVDRVRQYIKNQKQHHQRVSFQKEFLRLLKAHGIEYDERYIWK